MAESLLKIDRSKLMNLKIFLIDKWKSENLDMINLEEENIRIDLEEEIMKRDPEEDQEKMMIDPPEDPEKMMIDLPEDPEKMMIDLPEDPEKNKINLEENSEMKKKNPEEEDKKEDTKSKSKKKGTISETSKSSKVKSKTSKGSRSRKGSVMLHLKEKYDYNNKCLNAITLAFEKERADDRKDWLRKYNRNHILDIKANQVPIHDFINKELIHFSHEDTERSIPSMIDGMKPSQRKVYYTALTIPKGNLKAKNARLPELKVAQLAARASEITAYHHGEVSLQNTIVNMAQDYLGSNNINLLYPSGQFGTRLMNGDDSASCRYIFTRLEKISRKIFREEDNPVLTEKYDDGVKKEPLNYVPIIPICLVNGCKGIGTGFSTDLPCYDPDDIIQRLERKIFF